MREGEILVRVLSDHFDAFIVVVDDTCVEAAPIVKRALLGRSSAEVRAVCTKRGWRATIIGGVGHKRGV